MSIYNALCTNATCKVELVNYAKKSENEPAPKFCPECGSGVIDKCITCGTPTLDAYPAPKFCHECGEQLRFDPHPKTGSLVVDIGE